jgi:hypothetical protein
MMQTPTQLHFASTLHNRRMMHLTPSFSRAPAGQTPALRAPDRRYPRAAEKQSMGDAAKRRVSPELAVTVQNGEPDGHLTRAGAASGGCQLPTTPAVGNGSTDSAVLWRNAAESLAAGKLSSLAASGAAGGVSPPRTEADTFLASLHDECIAPGALLNAAAPAALPPPPEYDERAAARDGVVIPAFASQPAPEANATVAVLEAMLAELNLCGWFGSRRLNAGAVESLCCDFRPGASAAALHEFACRVRRQEMPRAFPERMSRHCLDLAKNYSKHFQDEYMKHRMERDDNALDAAGAALYVPPGAVLPALPADEADLAGALDAYRAAGWIGPGVWRISESMVKTLTDWRGDPRITVRALRRLPYIAAADLEAGCPLTACIFEESKAEFYKTSKMLWDEAVLARSCSRAEQQPRYEARQVSERVTVERNAPPRRISREPRGGSRDLRDTLLRHSPPEASGRRRSPSRSNGGGRGRDASGRSEQRSRSYSRERKRRSRSRSRSLGRSAAQHAPAAAPLVVFPGLEAPRSLDAPAYHCRNPLTGAVDPAQPLSLFRDRVTSGLIPLATAAATLIWRAGEPEGTGEALALVLMKH